MKSLFATPFGAIFHAEALFNSKRVAPYALMILFSANAVLWWGWGAAAYYGWATNSEFYIVRNFSGFSFLTMPLFIALMMGDPVIRDFRVGVDPLIFSKPVSRAAYLLGKFFGNFFVLVCCQACFALTLLLLQAVSTKGMIVLAPRALPYFQHFFFFVVVSSLALAAVCFAIGTLTRNVKIVYGLATSFYFLFIAWQRAITELPMRWRIALDPLLFNVTAESFKGRSADWLNQAAVSYDEYMIANRALMVAVSLASLALVCFRFSIAERAGTNAGKPQTLRLDLAPKAERLFSETGTFGSMPVRQVVEAVAGEQIAIPQVNLLTQGWRANLRQFIAALGVEFRLLRAERSLIVVAPLILFICGVELAAYKVVPEASYSATYAGRTANALLLFLFGIAVFYTGETMHRDRELKVEPVLWSAPAPSCVMLLSKFSATLLLSIALIALVALTAIGTQFYKGHTPLQLQAYLTTYAVILVPSAVFMIAASVALNVLLRDKYLTYTVSLAFGGATYYLASQGYNHPLSNPVLYQLWTPSELIDGGNHLTRILLHRIYTLALSALLLALAHLTFERKATKGLKAQGRLSSTGWAILVAVVSMLTAAITGLKISVGR